MSSTNELGLPTARFDFAFPSPRSLPPPPSHPPLPSFSSTFGTRPQDSSLAAHNMAHTAFDLQPEQPYPSTSAEDDTNSVQLDHHRRPNSAQGSLEGGWGRQTSPEYHTPPPRSVSMTSAPVLPPLFIDKIAKDFGLDERHTVMMHAFVQLGSVSPALSVPDLATRLYTLGAIFAFTVEQKRAAAAAAVGLDDLSGLFNDLKIRLEDTFTFTNQQKENIRSVVQDVIYSVHQTRFKTLFTDVQDVLEADKVNLRLTNVFGNPFRVKQLVTFVRRTCSSVRNGFRIDICDSVDGPKKSSLKTFSFQSALKYKIGGPGEKLDITYKVHNTLLRRFALDHPELCAIGENEDSEAAGEVDSATASMTSVHSLDGGPARKKRKTTAKGRVPKGEDFWSRVDKWFMEKENELGPKVMAPSWRSYVNEIITQDERMFPHGADFVGQSSRVSPAPSNPTQEAHNVNYSTSQVAPSPVSANQHAQMQGSPAGGDDLFRMLNSIARL